MSTESGKYWVVRLDAFSFDTEEEAKAFHEALIDAFCAMPEAKEIASCSRVFSCDNDDDETA